MKSTCRLQESTLSDHIDKKLRHCNETHNAGDQNKANDNNNNNNVIPVCEDLNQFECQASYKTYARDLDLKALLSGGVASSLNPT